MNAPAPFPVNPSIGEWFQNWVWNGNRWVCGPMQGVRVIIRRFMASGPWQPSPGLISVVVECIGGGGGGGGAQGSVPSSAGVATGPGWCVGGGGGSGGTYAKSALAETLVRGGVNMVVGLGGAGGQATQASTGVRGGNTAFGAFVIAQGGWGGGSNVITTGLDPAMGQGADPGAMPGESLPGAILDVGDMTGFGDAGQSGTTTWYDPSGAGLIAQTIAWGGTGGGTFYSGTWAAVPQTGGGQNGRPGIFSGVGGGGGASAYAANPALGGNGSDGVIVTTEYCFAETDDDCRPSCDGGARVAWDGQFGPPKGAGWRGGPPAGFSDDPSAYDNGE